MGINSITSTNSMSVMQMTPTDLKDQKSKSIQNEITDVQQQMQKLSSESDLSENEKANERKKLQKEISGLNTELEQHQEELLRSQKRERLLAELRENEKSGKKDATEEELQSEEMSANAAGPKDLSSDKKQSAQPGTVVTQTIDGVVVLKEDASQGKGSDVDTENKETDEPRKETADETETKDADKDMTADSRPSGKEIHAMVSADASLQQAYRLGTIISRTSDGIAFLKEEIKEAEERGSDTEKKQAELKKMERQEQLAMAFQFSILGEANNTMKAAAEIDASAKDSSQTAAENNAYFNALNLSQEEQTSPQRFFVSFG